MVNRKPEPTTIKITKYAVEVKSVHVGEIKRDQHYYLIRHWKPHAGWHELDLPASSLHGPQMIPMLADAGVVIHEPDWFKKFIRESVDDLHAKEKARMQFEQFGWKHEDSAFLYGDRLYTEHGSQTTAVGAELRHRAQWLRPVPGGSVAGWKQAVDCMMGKGSEGQSFTILASFGAVLMRFLESNEGGAVISLVTPHSGAGKSTSLAGAYTVWANNERGLGLTTIDTKVSKSGTLAAMCNLPVTYDEFSNKDPDVVREFMVMFTSGRDKMRADSRGQIIHNAASWQTILITAMNRSLVDTILSTGESDAPAMRVLEFAVESDSTLTPGAAAKLKKQMEDNAGWAGHAYLTYLAQPAVLDWAKKRLHLMSDEIFVRGGFRKEHRFWVRALAATATAALIVEKLDLIAFNPHRVINWALDHFAARVNGEPDPRSLLPTLSRFLNDYVGETLTMTGPMRSKPIGDPPRQRVTVRAEIGGETLYITEYTLRDWMAKRGGGGYQELLDELKAKGILKNPKKLITLTSGTEMRGGQVYCVAIDVGHPALTGVLREARAVLKDEDRLSKLGVVK